MAIGDILLWLAAGALAACFFGYILALRHGSTPAKWVRLAYGVSVASLTGAVGLLLVCLLGHRFDIGYVYQYSSTDLPLGYLISALWAGQEGSFLLWALLGGWVGLFLFRTAKDLETPAMLFWCLAQGLLLTMLIAKSPFLPLGAPATEGQGMNPVLQDPWMVIHPPILFLGFAVLTVPACLAAGALLVGQYNKWTSVALPWASFGWLALGAGLTLGGVWAYEVLGWGGYWGWDPVENSSLVPWITGTILLHGLILDKRKGTSGRVNFVFALLTYLLALYSTFLTRSGVLGDFSVHSFSDLGSGQMLAGLIMSMALFFIALVSWRYRSIPSVVIVEDDNGKELNYYLTIWTLSAIALVVLAGTSAPLITKILNPERPSGVEAHFYNSTAGPVSLVMLALVALCPLMAWSARNKDQQQVPPKSRWLGLAVLVAGIVIAVVFLVAGASDGTLLSLGLLGAAAFVINGIWFVKIYLAYGMLPASVCLAHAGFALMFVGIAGSNMGGAGVPLELTAGGPAQKALGWEINLEKVERLSPVTLTADFKMKNPLGRESSVTLQGSESPSGGYAFKPFIQRGALRDIYFAPREIKEGGSNAGPHGGAAASKQESEVAPLKNSEQLSPAMLVGPDGKKSEPVSSKDGGLTVALEGMSVEQKAVELSITIKDSRPEMVTVHKGQTVRVGVYDIQFQKYGAMEEQPGGGMRAAVAINVAPATGSPPPADYNPGPETLQSSPHGMSGSGSASMIVSDKPLMSVLWLGAVLVGIGSLLAVVRRFRDTNP